MVGIVCIVCAWTSVERYATALEYCSIVILLFGGLIVAGNSSRTEIPGPNYYVPTRREHYMSVKEHFHLRDQGLMFFLISLICAALVFGTGYLINKVFV